MQIKRHGVWRVYDDSADTLEAFSKNFIPNMNLRNEVSEDISKAYHVIRQLLIHSYFEYEFVDVAVTKLLQTFEMALKIRYEEINVKSWGKGPLEQLIEWFRKGYYFENVDKNFLKHVRNVRNDLSHPQKHSFGGIGLFHWFDTITDLINDLYGDLDLRKQRISELELINKHLKKGVKNGAILDLVKDRYIIYDAGALFIDNTSETKKLYGYYKTIFKLKNELKENEQRIMSAVVFELENYDYRTESSVLLESGPLRITQIEKTENRDRFDSWIESFKNSREDQDFETSLALQIQKDISKKRREILHSKHFSE